LKKGTAEKGEKFIHIEPKHGKDVILVLFHDHNEFEKWLEVFIEARKSDEELRKYHEF
jgi:hypothetical protein